MERTSSQKRTMQKEGPKRSLNCPHLFSNPHSDAHDVYVRVIMAVVVSRQQIVRLNDVLGVQDRKVG